MASSSFDRRILALSRSQRSAWYAAAPPADPEPHQSQYSPSLCVAPSAIFFDYDRVMASLKGEQEELYNDFEDDATDEIVRLDSVQEDTGLSPAEQNDSGSESDSNGSPTTTDDTFDDDDDEYHDGPQRVNPVPAIDISNTYGRRVRKSSLSVIRKARRAKPYSCRRLVDDSDIGSNAPSRCTYISPEDGLRCTKINKTPQEGGRHWRSCHLYKEAKEMLTGVLPIGQGTAITSRAQLEEVTPHIQCPSCSALITRSDAMRRHLRTNCKP